MLRREGAGGKQSRCRSHVNWYEIQFPTTQSQEDDRFYTDVRLKGNGLDLVEVQDNGEGISPENYESIGARELHPQSPVSRFSHY